MCSEVLLVFRKMHSGDFGFTMLLFFHVLLFARTSTDGTLAISPKRFGWFFYGGPDYDALKHGPFPKIIVDPASQKMPDS